MMQLPLDFTDFTNGPATGIHMENLISLWCQQGLTSKQADTLIKVEKISNGLDSLFNECLRKDTTDFNGCRSLIMEKFENWEEIPAWDEIWRLKLAFNSRSMAICPIIKRYTIIICSILPQMVIERKRSRTCENLTYSGYGDESLIYTPIWYQAKFEEYQERQMKREHKRQKAQEAWLRVTTWTHGNLRPPYYPERFKKAGDSYPAEWREAINESCTKNVVENALSGPRSRVFEDVATDRLFRTRTGNGVSPTLGPFGQTGSLSGGL
ncbi:hypothetical protein ACJZ2D_016982 [Fusarium nematophilum]